MHKFIFAPFIFSAQQHIYMVDVTLIWPQKRLKLGSWNFHHMVATSI